MVQLRSLQTVFLKDIRIMIAKHSDFERVNDWITVCLILHNLLIDFNDEWEEDEDEDDTDDNEEAEEEIVNDMNGESLRLRVQENALNWFFHENHNL